MTDETEVQGEEAAPHLGLLAQYLKDLSFENPNAPESYNPEWQPAVGVNVDIQAKSVGQEDTYEVTLILEGSAKFEDKTIFLCEVAYAGIFVAQNIPEEHLEPTLLIEAPRLLFPFARRILADATRDGNYPPLMLDPIDFAGLYFERKQQAQLADTEAAGNA